MNILEAIGNWFGQRDSVKREELRATFTELATEVSYKKLAVDACVNLIANIIAGCEFKTYKESKEHKGDLYYLLNVRPNINYSASEFWHKFTAKLLKNNEALIIMQNKELHVADSYSVEPRALYGNYYKGVTVGNFTFGQKIFAETDVLHVRLHDENINRVLENIYANYGKLIASAQGIYKRKNALRVVVEKPSPGAMDEESRAAEKKLFEEDFKAWFTADAAGAVLPLPLPLKLQDWTKHEMSAASQSSRDIRAMIDDVLDFTAIGYHIPVRLLKGDVAELSNALDLLLITCIKPYAEIIKDEINAKLYTKEEYLNRTYMKIDTGKIKMVDIIKFATAADKLLAAGAHSINNNLSYLDEEPINEEWANWHFITKNYQRADMQGGGEVGEAKN